MKRFTLLLVLAICITLVFSGCAPIEALKDIVRTEQVTETVETTVDEPVIEFAEADYEISPGFTSETDPNKWGIKWDIFCGSTAVESFNRDAGIDFGHGNEYYGFEGVSTFRGNNYRNDPTYGSVNPTQQELEVLWGNSISSLGEWSGCGWSGQPLVVRWEEETKQIMNIYPEKKAKSGLIEVIYATLDGNIYFYDLEDGTPTRDKMNVGMTFKGTGTLDPRGYPIMYIGSGIASGGKTQRMYAISLIDTTVLYEQGGDDQNAFRYWNAFDSSPLIDAETDTIIWPGENGILYTLKLNTNYDPANKKISINPENVAKCRYSSNFTSNGRWHGYESSCVAVGRYLYVSENSGMFYCVNLDTMELVWAQDVLDDTNSTPVFEWSEDGQGYIYTACALRWTAQGASGSSSIFKLDAKTGEVVWEMPVNCVRRGEDSGGFQSSPVLGRKGTDLENLVIYNVASSPSAYVGKLIAIDKVSGQVVWEHNMENYTWSSPAAVYTSEGKGYIVICDSIGDVKLINGNDGTVLSKVNIGSNVEASPAVFNDTLVVGTRGCRICGIKIK